jgi:hypothetical protein
MKLGTIFTLKDYDEAYKFVEENGYTIEEIEPKDDERQYKIVEIPVYVPTNEDISKQRKSAYAERTDPLTLRKMRKLALGEWTEEEEAQYVSEIQAISKEIEEEYPYKE